MANEYKYRMLIYPNITTNRREIRKDSYVVLLPHIINTLCKINKHLHIDYLLPIKLTNLKTQRADQVRWLEYSYQEGANTMRTNFSLNVDTFNRATSFKDTPYDILYTHLPEHTVQLTNLMMNKGQSNGMKVLNYTHWIETPKSNASSLKRMFLMNMIGLLECEVAGFNSQWLKDFILNQAKEYFNDKTLAELEKIIQVHQLGVDTTDFSKKRYSGKKVILFNHRGQASYTNQSFFIKAMEKLYKKRKDFEVHTTFEKASVDKYKWSGSKKMATTSREDYLKYIKERVYLHCGTFKGYSAWSISTTDALSMGVPSVLPTKLCYDEMVGEDYPLLYENGNMDDFISKVEKVLDDTTYRNRISKSLEKRMNGMVWDKQIRSWMNWKEMFEPSSFKMVGKDTKKVQECIKYIKKHKSVYTNQLFRELGFGSQFNRMGRIRNRLRMDNRIRFTLDGYEWVA